ncbi:ElaA protein [Hathewaya proteolytica DSM 3090]|uniref:ElaA protein n=1 Tax=Hathewaya proteolytica DSM 3090 TaxID=1121331 RepID=A0A1M6PTX6_9CLOT|nr:GNAT family N-acetyltransferase [Hathewaya proteolytica]SHK11368.1 ElaA protein [Hathewaya proteolytica DSM 3090]
MDWRIDKLSNLEKHDIDRIFEIRTKVFVEEQKCSSPDRDNKDDDAYHLFLMNYVSGEIIAYLRILERGVAYGEVSIGRLLVNPSYRRRGYAREAIHKAFDFIMYNLGESSIRISAQEHLVEFYESEGFRKTSSVYIEENIPHIEMLRER